MVIEGATCELTITETPSKALVEATGIRSGTYVLVIISGATTYTSAGTATASGNNVKLTPTNTTTDEPFTITINSATNIVIPANTRIKVGAFDHTFTTQTTPDTKGPFDLTASELCLPNGTTASSFASELETKWNTAKTTFYPLSTSSITVSGSGVPADLHYQDTDPGSMPIRFYVNDTTLTVYGLSGNSGSEKKFAYDLVIIRKSDGKGWLKSVDVQAPKGSAPPLTSSNVIGSPSTLTSLTGGTITTKTQLGTAYEIYAIVRYVGTNEVAAGVIQIYPDPEGK